MGCTYGTNPRRSIDELSESDMLIVLNTFIMTNSKTKTARLTNCSIDVITDVLTKYYVVIQDVMYDINLTKAYREKYTDMIEMAFETSTKILKIYSGQVDKIYNLYEKEPDKLVKDYLIKQLQIINSDLFNIIKAQLELTEQHKTKLCTTAKQEKIDAALSRSRCNTDEYMANQQSILDQIIANQEVWHYRNETTGEEFECDTREDMTKLANLKSGQLFENGTCSRAIEANDKNKLWTRNKNIRIWSE